MNRPVRKLFDLEIDEISIVDRPANQHGLIAFAKSADSGEGSYIQEDHMADFYDTDGDLVDTELLEHGDVVFDEDGNEYVFTEEGSDDRELADAGVGKALAIGAGNIGERIGVRGGRAGAKAADYFAPKTGGRTWLPGQKGPGGGQAYKDSRKLNRKRVGIAAGGAAGAGALGVGGYEATKKSAGDSILEQLSKAVTESDREAIIAKALDEVAVVKAENAELRKAYEEEQDIRITEAFISKAAEYNLPIAPEVFGPILKAMAEALDDEQLDILDQVLSSVSDTLYDEVGFVGESDNNSVLDQVNAYSLELVGKSDLTQSEAMVALLEANPAAYDAYLLENGR